MTHTAATKRIYAAYDDRGVYVYQAFKPAIVTAAVAQQTFGAGFSFDRMTWIKPSFGWMLHRSAYGSAHRQEAIARMLITHAGFREILAQAVPTSYSAARFLTERDWGHALERSEVRYQWDPDRDLRGFKLDRRAIQLGLRGSVVRRYVHEWIVAVEDVTELAHMIGHAVRLRQPILPPVPDERNYPIDDDLRHVLGYD